MDSIELFNFLYMVKENNKEMFHATPVLPNELLFATCRLHLQNCRASVFNCEKQRENSTMQVHCNETIKKNDGKVFSILYVVFMLLLCLRYEQTNNVKINSYWL